jgi:hypothetical protein
MSNHVPAQDPLCGGKNEGLLYYRKIRSFDILCEIKVLTREE